MASSSSSSEADSVNASNMIMEEATRWSISRYANEYYLMINGSRAQSKRNGTVFQRLASMTRQGDVMEFKTKDGKRVRLPAQDADLASLSQEVSQDVDVDDLEVTFQPLISSTPKTTQQRRKRQKVTHEPAPYQDSKYKGIAEVPLNKIKFAAKGEVLAEVNHERVEMFKESITRSKEIKRPVLPVLVEGESNDWEKENAESCAYILLGGYSLCQALRDLCTDEKFAHYNRVHVKVYVNLSPFELLQAGVNFQQDQHLLTDPMPTLEAKVDACRRLLFAMHAEATEEPPSAVSPEWRVKAAAALGVVVSSRTDLKTLEPTFQLALYSARCYGRLTRIFTWHEAEFGKPMKQSIFQQLQGLDEPSKFSILGKILSGQLKLSLSAVRGEAAKIKHLSTVRRVFAALACKTWEECTQDFPAHTQDEALQTFLALDFKSSVPNEFLEYVHQAQEARKQGNSSLEELLIEPVALSVLEVDTKTGIKRAAKQLKKGSHNVAVIAEGLGVASAWQTEIKKEGFRILPEITILKDLHACHLILGTDLELELPRLMKIDDVFPWLVETFSKAGDKIGVGVSGQDLSDVAKSKGRVVAVLHRNTGRHESTQATESNPSEYEFTDSDETL